MHACHRAYFSLERQRVFFLSSWGVCRAVVLTFFVEAARFYVVYYFVLKWFNCFFLLPMRGLKFEGYGSGRLCRGGTGSIVELLSAESNCLGALAVVGAARCVERIGSNKLKSAFLSIKFRAVCLTSSYEEYNARCRQQLDDHDGLHEVLICPCLIQLSSTGGSSIASALRRS